MCNNLTLSLPEELQHYLEARVADSDLYATPDEFVRDLIRRDMQDWTLVLELAQGLREAREGEFAEESITDILNGG